MNEEEQKNIHLGILMIIFLKRHNIHTIHHISAVENGLSNILTT